MYHQLEGRTVLSRLLASDDTLDVVRGRFAAIKDILCLVRLWHNLHINVSNLTVVGHRVTNVNIAAVDGEQASTAADQHGDFPVYGISLRIQSEQVRPERRGVLPCMRLHNQDLR